MTDGFRLDFYAFSGVGVGIGGGCSLGYLKLVSLPKICLKVVCGANFLKIFAIAPVSAAAGFTASAKKYPSPASST